MTAEKPIEPPVLMIKNISVYYAGFCAVKNVSLDVPAKSVTAMIGPSGCGKSTLLRSINRMNELLPDVKTEGTILFNQQDIYEKKVDVVDLRKRIGMVFQRPNPFPTSIFRNVAWGPTINGFEGDIEELVENSLKKAALWDEVKDKLKKNGLTLSGGQQQRLCIARAIAMQPEIILMDEPCSALDPISSSHIEDLLIELKDLYSIIIVTHNMQQAARVSNRTAFMYQGELIEYDYTNVIFTRPKKKQTEDYVTGKFG